MGLVRVDDVDKAWRGESGDKRNTKYAVSALAGGPVGALGYALYRESDRSKRERAAAIRAKRLKRKRKVGKAWRGERGDKRNTKYALSAYGGAVAANAPIALSGKGRQVSRAGRMTALETSANARMQGASFTEAYRAGKKAGNAVPGYKALSRMSRVAGLSGAAAGAGLYAMHRRRKRDMAVAKAGMGLLAKPWTANRFKAAGRLTRIKGADAAVRGTGYLGRNATPLVAGAAIGAGASFAATRPKDSLSKGLPSALRPAPGKLVRAMRNSSVRSRIEANTAGRAAGWYASRGMNETAAQRARIGRNFRFKSSDTFTRVGG